MRITVPTVGEYLEITTAASWHARKQGAAWLATQARWYIGDFLRQVPDLDAQAEWINGNPGQSSRALAEMLVVAEQFPPEIRRLELPWEHHELVHELPLAARLAALDEAADRDPIMPEQQVKQIAAAYRKPAQVDEGLFANEGQ